ncbi:MAG TPA: ferritin-like domain-containing protein [Kofleriaceae bacterium]|jgi:rubrerythrin|nr:ferritin-like domain-containing protein [Kofleriaceae bacterium]
MPMSDKEIFAKLIDLIQLDADAVGLYTKALEHIEDDPDVVADLESFRADHERHIEDLSQCVIDLGGEPPPVDRDLKGALLEVVTAVRSATGTKGALKAMRSNEKLTNKTYEKAAELEFPEAAAVIVAKNLLDERRHLTMIETHLDRMKEEPAEDQERRAAGEAGEQPPEGVAVEEEVVVIESEPEQPPSSSPPRT